MDHVLSEYSKKRWDRLEDFPRLIVIKLRVAADDKIVCHMLPVSANDAGSLSLSRMHMNSIYNTGQHAFLFEKPIAAIYNTRSKCYYFTDITDIFLGFLPHPCAKNRVRVKIAVTSEHVGFFSWIKQLLGFDIKNSIEWTCYVHPGHVMPLTPFVHGIYPFPNVSFMFCDVKIECGVKIECDDEYAPTMLCANLTNNYRSNIMGSNILLPDGNKLYSRQLKWDNDTILPDLQALIIEEQKPAWAKKRHDLIFRELMEKAWYPRRVTLEMLDT